MLADSVGVALLVVLETLTPAERLAFVLHDLFSIPFDRIAAILGRTPESTRQLASRARRRVRGAPAAPPESRTQRRGIVDAFLAALRVGDFEELVSVLDPELVVKMDRVVAAPGSPSEIRGADVWAGQAIRYTRGAGAVQIVLVNGEPGLILAPRGRLLRVLRFTFSDDRISGIEIVGDPATLRRLKLAVPEPSN